MKVVVIGYDKMLAALISGAKFSAHEVIGVFRIDRVKYSKFTLFFKDIFNPSFDFSFIKSHKLYDIKGKSVNSKEFIKEIKRLGPDVILVGSWSEKFGDEILKIPRYGVINCHPSILPKHRGANPYFWAIYSGDEKTGVTFHLMDENFDTGKILMQSAFKIDGHITGGALKNKAAKVAELMVGELLSDIENNKIIPVPQDEDKATYDKYPYDGIDVVDFTKEGAQKIYDRVRGLKPWGYCFCNIEGKIYKIKHVKILENMPDCSNEPGTVLKTVSDKIFHVRCIDNAVEVKVI